MPSSSRASCNPRRGAQKVLIGAADSTHSRCWVLPLCHLHMPFRERALGAAPQAAGLTSVVASACPIQQLKGLLTAAFFLCLLSSVGLGCRVVCSSAGWRADLRCSTQVTFIVEMLNVKETRLRTKNSARYIGSYFALKNTYKKS